MASLPDDRGEKHQYDIFLSYSSEDKAIVGRIQRYLESYRLPNGSRLSVYRDETDIQIGSLPEVLKKALENSACLVVCCSTQSSKSSWVARELEVFAEIASSRPIIPVLLYGEKHDILPPVLRDTEVRFCDLRAGWRMGLPRNQTRTELIRLIAVAADYEFRELLPMDKRRRRRNRAIATVVIAAIATGFLVWPVDNWDDVTPENTSIFGCDSNDNTITLFAMNVPEATLNTVSAFQADLAQDLEWQDVEWEPARDVRGRLLPGSSLEPRPCGGFRSWVGAIGDGLCISLSESSDMIDLVDRSGAIEVPATEVQINRDDPVFLDNAWAPIDLDSWRGLGTRLTPSAGLPVSAEGRDIWLATQPMENLRGQLWRSRDGGRTWDRITGMSNVTSVRHLENGVMIAGRKDGELGFFLYDGSNFLPFEAPGKGNDLEVCGSVGNHPILRIDRKVYLSKRTPWILTQF